MIIKDWMTLQEKEVFTKMLRNRKGVLAWDFTEMTKVKRKVVPSQKMQTVDYKAWQVPRFLILKVLTSIILDMLQERLKTRIIKLSHGPYQNP